MTNYKFILPLLLFFFCFFSPAESYSQAELLTKKDSLKAGDSISTVNPGGLYSKGAFTVRCTVIGDTIYPMARYGTSSEWVKTSVKNVRTQTSDTNIIVTASSWPVDYEINDPCILGFRLVSYPGTYIATRKTYVNFRFRREK